jgi:hypothetical protein
MGAILPLSLFDAWLSLAMAPVLKIRLAKELCEMKRQEIVLGYSSLQNDDVLETSHSLGERTYVNVPVTARQHLASTMQTSMKSVL